MHLPAGSIDFVAFDKLGLVPPAVHSSHHFLARLDNCAERGAAGPVRDSAPALHQLHSACPPVQLR